MSFDGLWTVTFASSEEETANLVVSEEINRGGVIVLTGGKMYGGGISYYFVGSYRERDGRIELTAKATRYNDLVSGAFGDAQETTMVFTGAVSGDTMKLDGHLTDRPQARMSVTAQRRHKT